MFYSNWEFTDLCHAFAISFKKKYNMENFSAIAADIQDYNFLKNQNDIIYEKLYHVFEPYENYEEEKINDQYLDDMEEKYGIPNLWLLVYSDRDLAIYNKKHYTHDQYKKLIQRYIRFTEKILDESKPDYIIMDTIATLPSYTLYTIAKKRGVQLRLFTPVKTTDRIGIIDNTFDDFTQISDYFRKLKNNEKKVKHTKEVNEFLNIYRNRKIESGYMQIAKRYISKNFSLAAISKKFPKFLAQFQHYYFGYHKKQYNKIDPLSKAVLTFERYWKGHYFKFSNLFEKPHYGEQYAFFALQLEPEMVTMVQAPMWVDQLSLIENIAKSLPINFKLYIKDHPQMVYFADRIRPTAFYHRVKKIPNVRLINPLEDSYNIIKNTKLVLTIGGTVGWEAILLKKPVIIFGTTFYRCLDSLYRCENINELPWLIKKALKTHVHNDEDLKLLLDAIYEKSFGGAYPKLYGLEGRMKIPEIISHKDFPELFEYLCQEIGLEKRKDE